jgi:hypothetical protein
LSSSSSSSTGLSFYSVFSLFYISGSPLSVCSATIVSATEVFIGSLFNFPSFTLPGYGAPFPDFLPSLLPCGKVVALTFARVVVVEDLFPIPLAVVSDLVSVEAVPFTACFCTGLLWPLFGITDVTVVLGFVPVSVIDELDFVGEGI